MLAHKYMYIQFLIFQLKMICNYSSVLFLCFIFILCSCIGSSKHLEFLFAKTYNVIKCSDFEYLIIRDWFKLVSSNISCPNQAEIFINQSPDIYAWEFLVACSTKKKIIEVSSLLSVLQPPDEKQNKQVIIDRLESLSNTINTANDPYPKAQLIKEKPLVQMNHGTEYWSPTGTNIFYTKFNQLPIICRTQTNLTEQMVLERCSNEHGTHWTVCYYEPLLNSVTKDVNWTLLNEFLISKLYSPSIWADKGGYYLDLRLLKLTTPLVSYSILFFIPIFM